MLFKCVQPESYQIHTGKVGHTGTDGSSPQTRMGRHTEVRGMSGESYICGVTDPEKVIESLLIDDGYANRGHRANIFNEEYKSVGIYTGDHKEFRVQTVLNYNGSDVETKSLLKNTTKSALIPKDGKKK